jgi:hypothetical protein
MKNWRISEKIISVCGKRLKGYNWLSKAPVGSSCPESEKMCGKDPDTFFCVPQESNCPILHLNVDKVTGELTYVNRENE